MTPTNVVLGLILAGVIYALVALPREDQGSGAPRPPTTTAAGAPLPAATATQVDAKPVATSANPLPAKPEPVASSTKDDRPLSAIEVRELQERLKALGFDPGSIDGTPGPQTAAAARARSGATRGPIPPLEDP